MPLEVQSSSVSFAPPFTAGAYGEMWGGDNNWTATDSTQFGPDVDDELIYETADDAAFNSVSRDESEIEIRDWPDDAIAYATRSLDEPWQVGTALAYASAPTESHRRDRRGCGNPSFGPIALATGLSALGSVAGALVASLFRIGPIDRILAASLLSMLLALVFGTLGRRSRTGRRAATIGRMCGWATPVSLLFMLVAALGSAFDLRLKVFIVVFPLLGYAIVAFLVTLIADAMLGTD